MGIMEALLSFIRRQIGLRTDTASANGSVHAKLAALYNRVAYASDTLQASADTERTTTNQTSFIKVKEILIGVSGGIRVKVDIHPASLNPDNAASIYVNGSSVESLTLTYVGYATYTSNLSGLKPGDRIQLYVKTYSGDPPLSNVKARNFRIYYDVSNVPVVATD